jgi:hypothetical protein
MQAGTYDHDVRGAPHGWETFGKPERAVGLLIGNWIGMGERFKGRRRQRGVVLEEEYY